MSHHRPSGVRRSPALLASLAALAAVAALWQPYAPDAVDLTLRNVGMSWTHPMGTDHLGRDVLSRILVGFANTLGAVAIVASVCIGVGMAVGILASSLQGFARAVLLRTAEFASVVPNRVAASAIVALASNSFTRAARRSRSASDDAHRLAMIRESSARPSHSFSAAIRHARSSLSSPVRRATCSSAALYSPR